MELAREWRKMLGLRIVYQNWLTEEEKSILSVTRCGLCYGLRRYFGLYATAFLSEETQFLITLIAAQRQENPRVAHMRCPASAFLKSVPFLVDEKASEFVSAVTMLLVSERLKDDLRDGEGRYLTRVVFLNLLGPAFRKAKRVLQDLEFPCECLDAARCDQDLLESAVGFDLRSSLQPTALVAGECFAHTALIAGAFGNIPSLRRIGQSAGRIVALIDACEDLNEDRKRRRYNPISACWQLREGEPVPIEVLVEVSLLVMEELHQIQVNLNDLVLPYWGRMVANVLVGGLPSRIQQSIAQLWVENHWRGRIPPKRITLLGFEPCVVCGMPHVRVERASSGESRCGRQSSPPDLWNMALLLPELGPLARDLGFVDEYEYVLVSTLSSVCARSPVIL